MKEFTRFYVRLFMFLMPILFLPITIDAFGFGKNFLIMVMALLGLVLWLVEVLINKQNSLKMNKSWWLMAIVTVWAWVLWYKLLPGVRVRTLMDVSGVGVLTSGLVWFFLWLQVTNKEEREKQLNWLTGAGVLTAVVSIIIFVLPASKMPINWPKDSSLISINANWSLVGLLASEILLLLFLAMEWGKRLMNSIKENKNYIVETIITSFLSLVIFLDIFKIYKNGWFNLDGTSAWAIAVETFKKSPIFGVGAGNFIKAFNTYRPDSYNLTANWANGFLHSNSGILNLWTELGIVGVVAVIVALMGMKKGGYRNPPILIVVVAGLFLPVNIVGMMLLVWVVSGFVESNKINLSIPFWIMPLVLFGGVGFSGFWLTKIVLADVYMRQSLVAAAKNDGASTYNLQIKAIGLNPNMADYRKVYSQTNLALASTLLTNKEISEEDKQKASTLVQQAVREAKAAIALDDTNPIYWSNLAVIYRQLVGVVDGSADWSYQAYSQAVVLESANPISKLDLGGLLFAAKKFDEADRVFEQVVTSKPDFANGWYNWAYSAKELKKLDYAVSRLTQAVALVPTTSGDYEKANGELTEWKKELAASAQGSVEPKAETLKTAEPLPQPTATTLGGQTELAPPAVEPTASATPTPTI